MCDGGPSVAGAWARSASCVVGPYPGDTVAALLPVLARCTVCARTSHLATPTRELRAVTLRWWSRPWSQVVDCCGSTLEDFAKQTWSSALLMVLLTFRLAGVIVSPWTLLLRSAYVEGTNSLAMRSYSRAIAAHVTYLSEAWTYMLRKASPSRPCLGYPEKRSGCRDNTARIEAAAESALQSAAFQNGVVQRECRREDRRRASGGRGRRPR